jgi:hypothetical protein
LQRIATAGAASNATVVAGAIVQVDGAGRQVRTIVSRGFRPELLRFGVFPPHPATYVRSDIARAVGAFDEQFRVAADFDYFLRLHSHRPFELATIDGILVSMRRGGASTSGLRSYMNVSRDMIGALRKQNPGAQPVTIYLRALVKAAQFMAT